MAKKAKTRKIKAKAKKIKAKIKRKRTTKKNKPKKPSSNLDVLTPSISDEAVERAAIGVTTKVGDTCPTKDVV